MGNKEHIIECALNLFYEKGYDAVGVQEIVEAAGVTKPTLYHYFGSKIGLLKEILNIHYEKFKLKIEAAPNYDGDVPKTLYTVALAFVEAVRCHYKFYMLMMALFYSARENETYLVIKPLIGDFYQHIVSIFERASHQLGNMRGRQKAFAIGFIGLMNHSMLLEGEQQDGVWSISEEKVIELVNQFMYGINS